MSSVISSGGQTRAEAKNCNLAGWAGKPGLSHFCPGRIRASLICSFSQATLPWWCRLSRSTQVYVDAKGGFLAGGSKDMRWAKDMRHKSGNLPGFGFGLVGPYSYDLVGQMVW